MFEASHIFLQIPHISESDLSILAIAISAATAITLAITLMLNWKAIKEDSRIKYIQIIRDLDNDLFGKEEALMNTLEEAETYAIRVLLTLSRIIYLHDAKKLPDDVVDYFRNYFAYGLTIKKWLDDVYPDIGEEDRKKFSEVENWCKKRNIELAPFHDLPPVMRDSKKSENE